MQGPGSVPGGIVRSLERLAPGDHGLVFGPRSFTPLLVELLVARAAALRFQLVLAHAGLAQDALAAQVDRAPSGRAGRQTGQVALLGPDGLAALARALAAREPSKLTALEAAAERLGFRGVFACMLHGGADDPAVRASEAALGARIGPRSIAQCVYPAPPAGRDAALRLLRAHTPGRMVMPTVWRLAERGPPDALNEDIEPAAGQPLP